MIELGTSAGLSTLYIAMPDKSANLVTIEGCSNLSRLAERTFEQFGLDRVKLVQGSFAATLPVVLEQFQGVDLVFFDGDHREESTLDYFCLCLEKAHNDTIFVLDDIHWSAGMERAWKYIVAHPSVTVSIDLFRIGIVFFRRESQKKHHVVRF